MDLAATSLLVWQPYNQFPGDTLGHHWWRLETGAADKLPQRFPERTAFIPLPRDHQCFQHVPSDRKPFSYYRDTSEAERQADQALSPCLQLPQLRILPAVTDGGVVVHYLGEHSAHVARIQRFEAPGAMTSVAGVDVPLFHLLTRDMVGKIARHYVATCTVPDGSSVGARLTWVPWRGPEMRWGYS